MKPHGIKLHPNEVELVYADGGILFRGEVLVEPFIGFTNEACECQAAAVELDYHRCMQAFLSQYARQRAYLKQGGERC